MIAPALAPLAPACPKAPKGEEPHTKWALPQCAPSAPAENSNGAAMAALRAMAARWRVPGSTAPIATNEHAPLVEEATPEGDDPEREAIAAHYAAPPSDRPYLPEDPCALRDGLLRGARMAADAPKAAKHTVVAEKLGADFPQFTESESMAKTSEITRAQAPAREGLKSSEPFTILSMVALPDTRRTPLAEVRVRMGVAEIVFQIAALRGQRWTVRPPRDADGAQAVFVPPEVKAALDAAIMSAADGNPEVKAHLSQRSW